MATKAAEKKNKKRVMRLQDCGKYTSGNMQKTGANTYRLFLNYKDESGKWKAKSKTYRPDNSKEPSAKALEEILRTWAQDLIAEEAEAERKKLEAAAAVKNQKPTVEEYVSSYIEGKAAKGEIERRTASGYRQNLAKQIKPFIGKYHLDELTRDIVNKWVIDCVTKPCSADGTPYAPRTVRKALVLLRSVLEEAVESDLISKNPAKKVKAPKVPKKNPNALDEKGRAQVLQFIAIDPSSAACMGYSLALLMGMRQGEICGLRWRNVDLERKTLDIVEALSQDNEAGADRWYMKEPKNDGSRRTLTIPDQLIEPLQARLAEARTNAFSMGMDYRDFYVIGFADGSPMNGDMLSNRWRSVREALGLKGTQGEPPTFHDLRHTWATKAVTDGTDIKTVSSVLGHSNAAMTLNIYASADPNAKKQAAQSVANSMFEEAQKHAQDGEVLEFKATGTEN